MFTSWRVFVFLLRPSCRRSSRRGEAAALCLCERLKEKRLFHGPSRPGIQLHSFANELDPPDSTLASPGGVKQTQIIVF